MFFAQIPETSGHDPPPPPPRAEGKEVFPGAASLPPPTLPFLAAAPQVARLEPLEQQVQHHGQGGNPARSHPGGPAPWPPLTGVCCDGSPERLVEPCLELNLFHDSANLPRLALRLRLRLSLSSRSEPPRSISAASLHFLPMLSPRAPCRGPSELSSRPARCPRLAPPLPPRAPGRARALGFRRRRQAALAPAIGSTVG